MPSLTTDAAMKVMKFGGTSVGSPESILNLKKIAENAGRPVVVVVSALGGVTDSLIKASREAAAGDEAYINTYAALVERHHRMIADVIPASPARNELQENIDALLEELRSIYKGVFLIQDLTPKTADAIVAYGERLSSGIVAAVLEGSRLSPGPFATTHGTLSRQPLKAGNGSWISTRPTRSFTAPCPTLRA